MAKKSRKKPLVTSQDLQNEATAGFNDMLDDKAAYEQLMQRTLAEALDQSFRANAGALADVPGIAPAETDERVLLPYQNNMPFTPGLEGFQDTAQSPIGPPEALATYAGKMGPIGVPYGRPATLNAALPALHPSARKLATAKTFPVDEDVDPAMLAPELPTAMASRVPQIPARLPPVSQAPYADQHSFGALLEQFFTPSTNIERATRPPGIR